MVPAVYESDPSSVFTRGIRDGGHGGRGSDHTSGQARMIFVELQLRATWCGYDVRYSVTDVTHIAERLCVRVRIFLIPYSLAQNQNIPYSCPLKGLYSLFLILMWGPI